MKRQFNLNPLTQGLGVNNLFQPQYTNHFEAYIYLPVAIADNDESKNSKYKEWFSLSMTKAFKPSYKVNVTEQNYGNTKVSFAGQDDSSKSGSFECTDWIGMDLEKILVRWFNLVYNPQTGQMGWIGNYKTNGYIIEYSGDGACINQWDLIGVWPSELSFGELSRDNAGLKSMTINVNYDLALRNEDASTRNQYEQAAADAAANMPLKKVNDYATENIGGPINPYKSPL